MEAQIAILVYSKLALQICKLAASLTRQECKRETSFQQVNASFEVTMGQRTCSKLALQTIAKNKVRTQPGIELATYRLVARRRYHAARSTTRGEDRFR
ncbi:hypothetical protein AVEN_33650-1 [Araneus ventricosus]|uniref:Uncharacterized protein n=1 Tax=Araneus ventricosus TaxID=182803 RepID=A0A4Y2M4A9_ARAVE|nr:hypothetical protein AVEN_33650-1 [Araneus ventricosus]